MPGLVQLGRSPDDARSKVKTGKRGRDTETLSRRRGRHIKGKKGEEGWWWGAVDWRVRGRGN